MVRDWPAFAAAGAGICFAVATASPHAIVEAPRAIALALPVSVPWLEDVRSDDDKADAKLGLTPPLAGTQIARR